MTHSLDHIICNGVGNVLRWAVLVDGDKRIQIPVYSRALLMIVIAGEGMPHKDVDKALDQIDKFRHKFYETVAQPGEQIHYSTPPYSPAEPPPQ